MNTSETSGGFGGMFQNIFNQMRGGINRTGSSPLFMPEGTPHASMASRKEILFDGKVVDFEGHIAGDIKAVQYEDGNLKGFDFTLAQDLRGGPTLLDRFAAKLSYNLLVYVMPPMLLFLFGFVPHGTGRSPRQEEQNFLHHRPHPA